MKQSKRGWIRVPIRRFEARPVAVVAHGSVALAKMGEGRNIPLLILDTSVRPDIDAMILAHERLGPGDVTSVWTFREQHRPGTPRLVLKSTMPSDCTLVVDFDMTKQEGMLVDHILWAQGVYIRPGRPGDRLATTMKAPTILIEVPRMGFEKQFQHVYEKQTVRDFRKLGRGRSESKRLARAFLEEWRSAFHRPMPFPISSLGSSLPYDTVVLDHNTEAEVVEDEE